MIISYTAFRNPNVKEGNLMIKSNSSKNFGYFVDRKECVDLFIESLENIGNQQFSVLVYYGVGELGKLV